MINSDKRRRLAFALYDAGRLMRKTIDQRVRGLGLSHAQWSILAALARNEGQRQIDLAGEMDLEPITVARLIDRLEAAGLVERRRDASDRRARRLYLKPAAETTLATLKKTGDEIMLSALAGLDEHEMDVATAVLERLRASFQAASQSGHGAEAPRADDVARPAAPDRLGRLQHVG